MIQIRVTGLKEVQSLFKNLAPNVITEVRDKGIPSITRNLQKRIKRSFSSVGYGTGPSSTGASQRSIKYKKTAKGAMVEIVAPWMALIEKGVRSHWVSPYTIKQHKIHPGSTMFDRAPIGEYGGDPVWWHWKGPFVSPAVQRWRPTILPKLSKFVRAAISKSRR